MAKTGPQRYPGASTAYWYQSKLGGDSMESNVIVWHTTEGTSLPSYSGGAEAPNFTAVPDFKAKRLIWFQHFDFDTSARALVNRAGGVETNTLNAAQVELVGTCDPTTHAKWTKAGYAHLYTPELPDWVIRDLGAFARWANTEHGVPLSSGLTFKAYPSSYGASSVRMSGSRWSAFKGHCGHQHVPENDHGDPGAFPMAAILTAAKGGTIPSKETDVALSAADLDKIRKVVWESDKATAPADAPDVKTNPTWQYQSYLKDTNARVRAIQAAETAQTAAITALAKLAGSGVDTKAVVAAVQKAITDAVIKVDVDISTPEA